MNETLTGAVWSLMYIPNWALVAVGLITLGFISAIAYTTFRFIRKHSRKLA